MLLAGRNIPDTAPDLKFWWYHWFFRSLVFSFQRVFVLSHIDWIAVNCRRSICESRLPFLNGSNRGLLYYGVICGPYHFRQQSKGFFWQYVSIMLSVASAWQLPSWPKREVTAVSITSVSHFPPSCRAGPWQTCITLHPCELFVSSVSLTHYMLYRKMCFFFVCNPNYFWTNVFVYCVGLPTQFAVSIHWTRDKLSKMRMLCMYAMQILYTWINAHHCLFVYMSKFALLSNNLLHGT